MFGRSQVTGGDFDTQSFQLLPDSFFENDRQDFYLLAIHWPL